MRLYTLVAVIAALVLLTTTAVAQELPRTRHARPGLAVSFVDGAVKLDRHFYRASKMAILLGGAFMQAPPVIRVLGVGGVGLDVATSTLAEAQAQGYRAYVGTAAGITVAASCSGSAPPFLCVFPLSQISGQLSQTQARALAVSAFVTAPDGERESARATAPFTLQLAAPPVAPTAGATRILPPQ